VSQAWWLTPAARKWVPLIGTSTSSQRSCTVQYTLWQSPTARNQGAVTCNHHTFMAIGLV
jgi:hypothetical protein